MIGVEHRIPEPTPETKAKCVESLLNAVFRPEAVETAMSVPGVPPGGRRPPKRRRRNLERGMATKRPPRGHHSSDPATIQLLDRLRKPSGPQRPAYASERTHLRCRNRRMSHRIPRGTPDLPFSRAAIAEHVESTTRRHGFRLYHRHYSAPRPGRGAARPASRRPTDSTPERPNPLSETSPPPAGTATLSTSSLTKQASA